ncbi:uncharacterized protein F4822DRAFT_157543 [Hypoxylon trugodes]|uniref:uncharacterized protein n=1 Tax=Hypoxylon trugodes TaxID=326681 RepID=UPI00219F009D|nr:uncharacterized protein F4822DRAFT_157543 [Hypoxylon trugodes]KAI1390660.1 hypothetical protein F4822DRAFT_157543 [Hypoxylon trugodes]
MEVLGAIAATGQLVGTVFSILDSIAQLRDFLKHAPARYQGWRDELESLSATISGIRDDSSLHTCQVGRIIEAMEPKIDVLIRFCARYSLQPKPKLIKKLQRAFSARKAEARILQNFESLERDKTALILTITTQKKANSVRHPRQSNRSTMSDPRREGFEGPHGSPRSKKDDRDYYRASPQGHYRPSTDYTNYPEVVQCPSPQPTTIYSTESPRPVQESNRQRSVFKNVKRTGHNCLFGDTTGNGVEVDGYDAWGNGNIEGTHSDRAASTWTAHVQSQSQAQSQPQRAEPLPLSRNR